MGTWLILTISIVAALVLGLICGALIGKYIVKRQNSPRRALLSSRERAVYAACVLLGVFLILMGVFYKPPVADMELGDIGMADEGFPAENAGGEDAIILMEAKG